MIQRQEVILERLFEQEQARRRTSWLMLAVLMAVGVWMVYVLRCPIETLRVWDIQDPQQVVQWGRRIAVRYLVHAVAFSALGVLLGAKASCSGLVRGKRVPRRSGAAAEQKDAESNPNEDARKRRSRDNLDMRGVTGRQRSGVSDGGCELPNQPKARPVGLFLTTIAGWVLLVVACVGVLGVVAATAVWMAGVLAIDWGLQFTLDVVIGFCAVMLGAWLGMWWRIRRSAAIKQAIVAGVLFVASGIWLQHQVIQREPLRFAMPLVSAEDKRELVELLKRRSVSREGYHVYRLSQTDLNKLLAWWMPLTTAGGKAKVILEEGTHEQFLASLPLPGTTTPRGYVNFRVHGRCEVVVQQLDLSVDTLEVGTLRVPSPICDWLGHVVTRWIASDAENMELLTGVVRAAVTRHGAELVLSDDGLRSRRIATLLRQVGGYPNVVGAVREHLNGFAQIARDMPGNQPLFTTVVRDAFERAGRQSRTGNAVKANQAAILALGIALGHIRLEHVVGDCWDGDARLQVSRLPLQSELRGRPDWARHFWVSAALTLVADNRVSDAVGLMKEELDSGEGGSGFSFGDLMADRAGTEFARAATRNESAARAIQQWIRDASNDLNQLMPPADDLPEGLSDAQLQQQYGGVHGKRYNELLQEMEKRLDKVAWNN